MKLLIRQELDIVKHAESGTVVVDACSFGEQPGISLELSGREKLELLQNFSRIAEEEEWTTWLLFVGEEMPQVAHGGDFKGMRVFYAPKSTQRIPTLLECVRVLNSKNKEALLISDDPVLEERLESAEATLLHASTLKKGYDCFQKRRRPHSRLMTHRSRELSRSELH